MSPGWGRSGRSFAPPRWVYRTFWALHRAGYAITGGRLGLRLGHQRPHGCAATAHDRTQVGPGAGDDALLPAVGEERDQLWHRFVERLADYQRYADSAERDIPVVILEPIAEEADA